MVRLLLDGRWLVRVRDLCPYVAHEGIRMSMAEMMFRLQDGNGLHVTVSIVEDLHGDIEPVL